MRKSYLLTPGPTPIPESISAILAQPIIHHRTPAFESIFQNVKQGLKVLFQTQNEVLVLTTSGTGAMEAALTNLFSRGQKVITVNGGKFGERWTHLAKAFALNPIEITLPAGEALNPATLEAVTQTHPDAKGILFQASETSTGVVMPTREICKIAAKAGMISVCDAITACGVFDLPMDEWQIDVLMTGSQKALMLPPGLAMIALSDRAWRLQTQSDLPKFYFDLGKERKGQAKNQTPWTPAISLIQGLQESLRLIQEEGLPSLFKRHDLLARATRNAIHALGLELLAKTAPSNAVTAVKVPHSIPEGKRIPQLMRDKHGVTIAGGQDELEGKIFRLSHFGYCGRFDVMTGIAALELVLHELGHPFTLGAGVSAVLRTYAEG
jgi:aspartate aminotransferase-like enzyme